MLNNVVARKTTDFVFVTNGTHFDVQKCDWKTINRATPIRGLAPEKKTTQRMGDKTWDLKT